MAKVAAVLPTYNEKDNIKLLIPQLVSALDKSGHKYNILFVDDNSPDGTSAEIRKFQKKFSSIKLINGKKKGLGDAYLRGFSYAINKLKADYIIMMDSDLQHPPKLVINLIENLDKGYDICIASRYIKGGGVPDFSLLRKSISAGGNFFARVISGMYKIHDCTSGFRAFKSEYYNKIDLDNLSTKGYAFLSTLLFEMLRKGAKPKEIPFIFKSRKYGESKLKTKDMIEFFINAWRLRFKTSKRFIKFGIVGASGIIINIGLLFFLTEFLQINYKISSLISVEASIIWNFIINDRWTFESKDNKFFQKLIKFQSVALIGFLVNYLFLLVLTEEIGIYYILSNLIGIGAAFLWNYFANKKWTWRET